MSYSYYVFRSVNNLGPITVFRLNADTLRSERYDRKSGWIGDKWLGYWLSTGETFIDRISEEEALELLARLSGQA